MVTGERAILRCDGVDALLQALRGDGWTLLGPTVRDGAIVCGEIAGIDDLPLGWTADQEPGRYRLRARGDRALFGFAVGPQSWKPTFFPPRSRLLRARREGAGFTVEPDEPLPRRVALVGARSCDLHAIAVQDRVFLQGAAADPDYAARRAATFVVAVQCGEAGGTCFCVSMGTGPKATGGFDVALTELLEGEHRFLAEAGSERGAALLARIPTRPATDDDTRGAAAASERAAASMGRRLDAGGVRDLLLRNLEHPRWEQVAARCLSCANCTLVCPTCFCWTVEDVTDLRGEHAERWRTWDSCFTLEHSYVHGGSVRGAVRSRYRQWLTHKLATWHDQFGTSGCVGCGRCITWCPVGIDITEEVAAIAATDEAGHGDA